MWIPSTDKQKPGDGCVLVATEYADFPVWFGYFEDGKWFAPDTTEIEVTHWMPLPKGPQ